MPVVKSIIGEDEQCLCSGKTNDAQKLGEKELCQTKKFKLSKKSFSIKSGH